MAVVERDNISQNSRIPGNYVKSAGRLAIGNCAASITNTLKNRLIYTKLKSKRRTHTWQTKPQPQNRRPKK